MTKIIDFKSRQAEKAQKDQSASLEQHIASLSSYEGFVEQLVDTWEEICTYGGGLLIPDPNDPNACKELIPHKALGIVLDDQDNLVLVPSDNLTVKDMVTIGKAIADTLAEIHKLAQKGDI